MKFEVNFHVETGYRADAVDFGFNTNKTNPNCKGFFLVLFGYVIHMGVRKSE